MRLVFIALNYSESVPVIAYLNALLIGLRFDIAISTILLIPFILFSPDIYHKIGTTSQKIYFVIITSIIVLVSITDTQYYLIMGNRFDLYAIKHIQFVSNHLGMLNMGGVTIILLLLLLLSIIASIYFFNHINKIIPTPKHISKTKLIKYIISLVISIILIRGGLQAYPLNQAQSIFSEFKFANDSATNSLYRLYYILKYYTFENKFSDYIFF